MVSASKKAEVASPTGVHHQIAEVLAAGTPIDVINTGVSRSRVFGEVLGRFVDRAIPAEAKDLTPVALVEKVKQTEHNWGRPWGKFSFDQAKADITQEAGTMAQLDFERAVLDRIDLTGQVEAYQMNLAATIRKQISRGIVAKYTTKKLRDTKLEMTQEEQTAADLLSAMGVTEKNNWAEEPMPVDMVNGYKQWNMAEMDKYMGQLGDSVISKSMRSAKANWESLS